MLHALWAFLGNSMHRFDTCAFIAKTFWQHHVKMCFGAYVDNDGSDQTARMCSLIRAIIVHCQNHWILFVCVEVLRPSQSNGAMSSAVSLPNHTFTGQA